MYIVLIGSLYAQQSSLLFVSRVAAVPETSSVKITWQDPNDESDFRLLILRYTSEITKENVKEVKAIAVVEKGEQNYTDFPPDTSEYYYAVLIQDESGIAQDVLIAFRNKTTTAVKISEVQNNEAAKAEIKEIKAVAKSDAILLTYTASRLDRELIIYRSTSPIIENNDLVGAILIDSVSSDILSYTDRPIPGIPYYYAVFDAVSLKIGKPRLTHGQNILSVPVEIQLADISTQTGAYQNTRAQPLPFLQLNDSIQTGESLRSSLPFSTIETMPLSADTRVAVESLLKSKEVSLSIDPEPTILPPDVINPDNADPYALSGILTATFLNEAYEDAEIVLRSYLGIKRSEELTSRAHFYIGQCYYFLGKYREAFIEFLFAEDIYYAESQVWIDILYEKLKGY